MLPQTESVAKLAVIGAEDDAGVDTGCPTLLSTIGFAVMSLIMSQTHRTCNAAYDIRSSDLSRVCVGTGQWDASGYERQHAGKQDASNIIRRMKPRHGL